MSRLSSAILPSRSEPCATKRPRTRELHFSFFIFHFSFFGNVRLAVIPGDGIGPEVVAQAVRVIRHVADVFGRTCEIEELPWSADYYLQTGVTVPADGYAML